MKKRFLALTLCLAFLFTACGEKASEPVNSKVEKETTVSTISAETSTEDVSSNNGQSTISKDEEASEEAGDSYEDYDYDYSESGYEDYGYEDYSYDGGYDGGISYGAYDDGMGGYLCDYGTYYAEINTPDGPRTKSSINVYNTNGLMGADIYVFDINDNYDSFSCTIYQDATEAFGDASRNTEVEMNVSSIDSNSYSYNGEVVGGSFTATVYWPSSKCYYKLTCPDGTVYEYTCYPQD